MVLLRVPMPRPDEVGQRLASLIMARNDWAGHFSVIEPGEITLGSKVEILSRDANRVTVVDIVRLYLGQTRDPDLRQRAVNVSVLPENWRAQLLLRAQTDRDDTGS